MTVHAQSVVVGLERPDMSRTNWRASLRGTPAEVDADEGYDRIWKHRVSHAFCRAVFRHESSDGTRGICAQYNTKSPGNTRSTRIGKGEAIFPPGRGQFWKYESWADGWEDLAFRLVDPDYVYAKEGRRTPATIIPRFAPPSDGNNPQAYIDAVVRYMNNWSENGGAEMTVRLALSAGHHNRDRGGTAGEYERTGVLTNHIARKAREVPGFDVRVITPNDGLGDHSGSLYDAAREVVTWAGQGWTADVFLEVHFEGNGAHDAGRGSFAIYPDWGGDVDVDVRDRIGPALALKLQQLTGIPPRNRGVMSEKQTGVGSQGHRLGVFRATESLPQITRLIYEYGALTSPADRALIEAPGFFANAAEATVTTLAAFYGIETPAPPDVPDALYVPGNPFGQIPIVHGFRSLFEGQGAQKFKEDPIAGALSLFGYPMTAEEPTEYGARQFFERAIFKFYRDAPPPWDLVIALRSEAA